MYVHQLPPGEKAPDHSDRVIINSLPSGKFGFSGIYQSGDVEAHTVTANDFDTEEEALNAALSWAEPKQIDTLYVEHPDA